MLALFREQPRAFHMIFMLELWERFGFYTVQGIITLYFIRFLGYSETDAYYTFGAFSALVYGLVVVGGYLGDHLLGTKRTIMIGLVVLIVGYASLAFANSENVFIALGLICIGNGLFKANPANLLSKCYAKQDPRLHGGFTLYYMSVNIGSMFALFLGPLIASRYGYSPAYMLSALGLVLGLVNYVWRKQSIASIAIPADEKSISFIQWVFLGALIVLSVFGVAYLLQHVALTKNLLVLVMVVVGSCYLYLMWKENRSTRIKMLIAMVLMLEAILFFTLYQQMPTSLNLFAVNNVSAYFFGLAINPQSFQALNPIWIIIMSPVLASIYKKLHHKKIHFAVPQKFALGMTMCGFSFLILYISRYSDNGSGMVSSWWLVGSYLLQSIGELLVSALGVAMVAELVPAAIAGFVMGMWFLTTAVAGFLGASVASYTALPTHIKPGIDSLMIYTDVFGCIGLVTLLISAGMWVLSPLLCRYMVSTTEASEVEPPLVLSVSNAS